MTPRLLDLRFRTALWIAARTMPLRVRGMGLKPLLELYEPGRARPFVGVESAEMLEAVRRVTHHPWGMRDRRCLRQGLLAYRYLSMAGLAPALHFGVDRNSISDPKISAHCWIVLDGKVVLNPPGEAMVTVFVYDGPRSLAGARVPEQVVDRSIA
jgi:hypothetical protein